MTDTVDVAVPVTDPGKQQLTTARDFWQRIARTMLQLVAGGALAALTNQLASDIPPAYSAYLVLGYTLLVTVAQNAVENRFPQATILKRPPVV